MEVLAAWGQAPAQAARLYGAFPFTPQAGTLNPKP